MVYLDEQLRTIAGWNKDDLQLHAIEDNNRLVTKSLHSYVFLAPKGSQKNKCRYFQGVPQHSSITGWRRISEIMYVSTVTSFCVLLRF